MDHKLWKNREHIEETLRLLQTFYWPKKLQRQETPEEVDVVIVIEKVKTKLEGALKLLESFQAKNADRIFQDIGFSVEYISSTGQVTMILPYRRCESDQGNFCTCIAGSYKLIWDNSYSNFFKKTLRYKVDAIPPVIDAAKPESETDVSVV